MRRLAIGLLVAGLLAASGCAGPRAFERDGVHLLVGEAKDWSRQASASGMLHLVPGGCVGLSKDGVRGGLIVWPAGTTLVDTDPVAIHIPGVGRVTVGQEIHAGGGQSGPEEVLPAIPEACRQGPTVFVIDQASSVRRGPWRPLTGPGA